MVCDAVLWNTLTELIVIFIYALPEQPALLVSVLVSRSCPFPAGSWLSIHQHYLAVSYYFYFTPHFFLSEIQIYPSTCSPRAITSPKMATNNHMPDVEKDHAGSGSVNGGYDLHHDHHDPDTALRRLRTAGSISITPELFEKIYLSPKNRVSNNIRSTFGNPTPLSVLSSPSPLLILTYPQGSLRFSALFDSPLQHSPRLARCRWPGCCRSVGPSPKRLPDHCHASKLMFHAAVSTTFSAVFS